MNIPWQYFGVGLLLFSTILYLTLRWAKKFEIPLLLRNLSMSGFASVAYLLTVYFLNKNLWIDFKIILAIAIIAFAFSYLGNKYNLISMELSTNPGLPLTYSKSYFLFTFLIGLFLGNSEWSLSKLIGIILTLVSIILLIPRDDKSKANEISFMKKIKESKWFIYATYSFFAWGLLSICSKYLFNIGVDFFVFFFWLSITNSILFIADIVISKQLKEVISAINYKRVIIIVLLGTVGLLFNFCNFYGIKTSPNPGYINAINTSSMAFVTFFSAVLFKDKITRLQIMGVCGCIVGIIIMILIK